MPATASQMAGGWIEMRRREALAVGDPDRIVESRKYRTRVAVQASGIAGSYGSRP